jgi:hypothetical protein
MPNTFPTLSTPIADQTANTKTSFTLNVSSSFSDADGDTLVYSAKTIAGGSIPSWLSFDPQTGIFTGTPVKGDVAVTNISVVAADQDSGLVSDAFALTVAHTNEAPVLAVAFSDDMSDPQTNSYSFETAAAFSDPDGDALTYSAYIDSEATSAVSTLTLSAGLNAADTATITLVPGLTIAVVGSEATYDTAAKLATAFAAQTAAGYTLTASGDEVIVTSTAKGSSVVALDPNIVTVTTADSSAATGGNVTFTSSDNQAGTSLPDWLMMNVTTGVLSGTPVVANSGIYNVAITATDPSNESVSDSYNLLLWEIPDNVAPKVESSLVGQTVNSAISKPFTLATAGAFSDADGDTLTYSIAIDSHTYASMEDLFDLSDDLPSWLIFNTSTGVFSGTPIMNTGQITYQVTATDPEGLSVTDVFVLANKNMRDFLVNTQVLGNQSQAVVSTVGSGGFKVTWLDGIQDSDFVYRGQLYTEQGTKVGVEFLVDESTANLTSKSSLATLTGGTQVRVFQRSGADGYTDIVGELYTVDNEKIGSAFQINSNSTYHQHLPSVAPLTGGDFVVSWHGFDASNNSDIFVQRINVNGEIIGFNSITGTDTHDVLTGTVFDDFLLCLGGNDVVNNTAGSDYLDGGEGLDICVFTEAKSLFTLSVDSYNQWQVKQGSVTDTLEKVERLYFSDVNVALDLNGNAGFVAKLIGAVFGSDDVYNRQYVGAGLYQLETVGLSRDELVAVAIGVGGMVLENHETSLDFYSYLIANLWVNAVGTTITTELADPFIEQLTDGRLSVVGIVNLATETDYNKTQINLSGLASSGIEYLF